jgi:integrase-like protein
MLSVVSMLLASISAWFRFRLSVQRELIALRHQVTVYKQSISRPQLRPTDRLLWVWLSRLWPGWQEVLACVQPRTVIAWQKQRCRNDWRRLRQNLLRDRDAIYGQHVQQRIKNIGIEEVNIAPRSPWQHPYCERVIGSIRRDVLDHVIVLHARHLMRLLTAYFSSYHRFRTHLSLAMDCPIPRAVEPPEYGPVRVVSEVGSLHHHSERIAARERRSHDGIFPVRA